MPTLLEARIAYAKRKRLPSVEHPPVVPKPVFANHAEWQAGALSTFDCEGGHGDRWQRAGYDMLGYSVFLETFFPWNFFKEITTSMIVESFNVTAGSREMKLAEKFGGVWEQGYYAEPGHGWPRFRGDDCTERCWNFLSEWKHARKAGNPAVLGDISGEGNKS
jgi:hypothetical protein